MALERPVGSPREANYFLNLVTNSPSIRHSCEKFVILFENLMGTDQRVPAGISFTARDADY
jgi:hypothetical protein